MAVELRNHLARFGGVALPATLAFDYPTLEALTDRLSAVWSLETGATPAAAPKPSVKDDLEGLTDEDVEALLAAELDRTLRRRSAVMSDPQSTVKRALLHLRTLRGRLEATEGRIHAPVAVIGMGLRLPGGVEDAEGLEQLLWGGVDAIGDIPADRWPVEALFDADPDAPGRMSTRFGGFLKDVDKFDAAFFGISPREAASDGPTAAIAARTRLERPGERGRRARLVERLCAWAFTWAWGNVDYTPRATLELNTSSTPICHRRLFQRGSGPDFLHLGRDRAGGDHRHGLLLPLWWRLHMACQGAPAWANATLRWRGGST